MDHPAWTASDWETTTEPPFCPGFFSEDLGPETPNLASVTVQVLPGLRVLWASCPRWWNNASSFLVTLSYSSVHCPITPSLDICSGISALLTRGVQSCVTRASLYPRMCRLVTKEVISVQLAEMSEEAGKPA